MTSTVEQSSQLLIFVPEGQRKSTEVPVDLQDQWVMKLLELCSDLFGGATAYGRGIGVWREIRRGRPIKTHWDRVTVIESWIDPALPKVKQRMTRLARNLDRMRKDLRQKEVACIIDGRWKSYR